MIIVSHLFGNEPIDALENRFRTANNDTIKIDLLLKMGDYYEDSDFDNALKYYNQALGLCRNKNQSNLGKAHLNQLRELEMESLRRIAFLQSSWEYFDEASENYHHLLDIYRDNNDIKEIIFALISLGNIHYFQSQWTDALSLYQEALTLAQNNNFPKSAADLRNNIATLYYQWGDYVRSLHYFQIALNIYDSLADLTGVGQALMGIGNIFSSTKNYDRALESYQSAEKYFVELNDHSKLAAVYTSLGALHHENDNFDDAEKYYLLTIEKSRLINDNHQLSNGFVNMAILCGARNQIDEAMNYLDQVLVIATRTSNKYIENVALRNKAVNHSKLGNYPLALKFAKESLEISIQIESIDDQAEGYRTLSEISQKMGDNLNALQYYHQYKAMDDSLLNIDTQRQLTEMQAIFQSEKQEQRIEVQTLEIEKNKVEIKRKNQILTSIIGLMVLVIILATLVLFFNTKEKMKNQDIARQGQIITNNLNKIKNLQFTIENQNDQIRKLENNNKSWKLKISDHQLFARDLLITTTGCDEMLNSIFPGKSFTYPDAEMGVPIDICYFRKLDNEILTVVADLQMNKLNKTMVNLAMNAFLDQMIHSSTSIHPGQISLSLKKFFESLTDIQRLPYPIVKLAVICINTHTKKIKIASEHISVYIAIGRNSQSIFRPIYEYHELQRLDPIINDTNSDNGEAATESREFKLKSTDRLYIINAGMPATSGKGLESGNPFEAEILRMIDTAQNMEIDLQGHYLRKELRIMASRKTNLIPSILTIKGIEL